MAESSNYMNLALIDSALASYKADADERDASRFDFFRGLWDIQERYRLLTPSSDECKIPEKQSLLEWYWAEKPFFVMAPLEIDKKIFVDVVKDCSDYMADNAGFQKEDTEVLRSFDWEAFITENDLSQAGYDPFAYIETCMKHAEEHEEHDKGANLDPEIIAAVLFYALRPLLENAAFALMDTIASDLKEGNTVHDKPLRCPVCGGEASAALVGETPSSQGKGRMLYCAACGTTWEFERIRCAHCGTRNQGHLHYFHIEGDDMHRMHNCQECGDYMRTVFQEESKIPFSFEVEDVVMTRLDRVAHDPRFESLKEDHE